MAKFLNETGLAHLWAKVKATFFEQHPAALHGNPRSGRGRGPDGGDRGPGIADFKLFFDCDV